MIDVMRAGRSVDKLMKPGDVDRLDCGRINFDKLNATFFSRLNLLDKLNATFFNRLKH